MAAMSVDELKVTYSPLTRTAAGPEARQRKQLACDNLSVEIARFKRLESLLLGLNFALGQYSLW